ncbi:DUF3833 domain-containing protein [Alginatibacterium sediminis]|uniref:DUF3833 domain-containing protein n=1 Tax=Alginatibacterium sediminis TaxID=2164068 RepID=A0A420E8H4_9ALTE|nr:DUF3833 domain-containing protein [Alginatibacterium sediminis]RKF15715.1 DUF3833 domain-containing protein [Alginatibacterium sediminis]
MYNLFPNQPAKTQGFLRSLVICASLLLSACSAPSIEDYVDSQPTLNLEQFFDGPLLAHGIVRDRNGLMTRSFVAQLQGSWKTIDGKLTGTLDEDFIYNDGEISKRIWTIVKQADNSYTGTASDIEGEAVGESSGSALRWVYQLYIEVDDTQYLVDFDDWMYLVDEHTILNHSVIKKWGFEVGEVMLSIRRLPE